VCRKTEEYAERNFLSTMPGDFKGIAFRKNLMGVIYLPKMNSFKIKFFGYLEN
jgi:hypothetical protein